MADASGKTLDRLSPWAEFMKPGSYGRTDAGELVTITPLSGTSSVSVIARKGTPVTAISGLAMPETGRWVANDQLRIASDGPGQWRVVAADMPEGQLYQEVKTAVGSTASVMDQSHGWVSVRLSGEATPDVLSKGSSIDFHLENFGAGQCAATQIHHMMVHITCVDDEPRYELQLFRSMAGTFSNWLRDAAGEYGCNYT